MTDVDHEIQWIKNRLAEHEHRIINLEEKVASLRSGLD